ncbi:MAG TPA: pitrilysin family protein [Kofleriaceae bacterium]
MKRAAVVIATLVGCHPAPTPKPPTEAAIDQPPPPPPPTGPVAPADPKPIVDGDVVDAQTHGIRVLIQRAPGVEEIATGLYIAGGSLGWDARTAGIEQLALSVAANGGTRQLDKDRFTRKLSDLGSQIGAGSNEDYSQMTAWSLKSTWDDTFALLVDAFRDPALPASEIEIQRQRQLSDLKQEADSLDARLDLVTHQGMFKGHPYENRAIGTIETVSSFTAPQLAAHLAKLRESQRLLVVVVGDVDADHVIATVGKALGDLPAGSFKPNALPAVPAVAKGEVTVVADKLPTNYIQAVFIGPRWTDPDFIVARVAMRWLGTRGFEEVRTKRNLSQAPAAFFNWNTGCPTGALSVTAADPRMTMKVMLDEAKQLRDTKLSEHDLVAMKAELLTGAYLASEAPADQAAMLAASQLRGGDWHFVRTFPDRVKAVTADQVQAWAQKAITHLHTFVIGDGQKIDKQLLETF